MHHPKLAGLQKQTAVERLFGKEVPAQAVPVEPAAAATTAAESELLRKSYRILRGRLEPLSKLRLVNRQGEAALVDYSSITWVNLRPSGDLVLRVSDGEPYTVTISGRGLGGELFDGLQDEKVEWVQELEPLVAAGVAKADPAEPVVTGIYIREGSVSREWSRGAGPAR
jgi:hypothetical protein